MSFKPIADYYPPFKARGMSELVGAKKACILLHMLVDVPSPAATSVAISFVDADGVAFRFADALYVVTCQAEGTIMEVDESTKTVSGCTLLSKDYAGSASNILNKVNVNVIGRGEDQPATVL